MHFPNEKFRHDGTVPDLPVSCKWSDGCRQYASIVEFDAEKGNATLDWLLPNDSPAGFKRPTEGDLFKIVLNDEQVRTQKHRCIVSLLDAYGNLIEDRKSAVRARLIAPPSPAHHDKNQTN